MAHRGCRRLGGQSLHRTQEAPGIVACCGNAVIHSDAVIHGDDAQRLVRVDAHSVPEPGAATQVFKVLQPRWAIRALVEPAAPGDHRLDSEPAAGRKIRWASHRITNLRNRGMPLAGAWAAVAATGPAHAKGAPTLKRRGRDPDRGAQARDRPLRGHPSTEQEPSITQKGNTPWES